MKKILHISCSPRGQTSESNLLAQKIIGHLQANEPEATLVTRIVGGGALAHVDSEYALALGSPKGATEEQAGRGSLSLSEELIVELEAADYLVIGTPMHNFTVPSSLKAWIDHIVRIGRTFNPTPQGKVGTLRDRPVYIAISSGGKFSGERARQPDFLTPYLKAILGTVGLFDLRFFAVEGTVAGGPEGLAEARTMAYQALEQHFDAAKV